MKISRKIYQNWAVPSCPRGQARTLSPPVPGDSWGQQDFGGQNLSCPRGQAGTARFWGTKLVLSPGTSGDSTILGTKLVLSPGTGGDSTILGTKLALSPPVSGDSWGQSIFCNEFHTFFKFACPLLSPGTAAGDTVPGDSSDHSPTHFQDPGESGHSFKKKTKLFEGEFDD